MYKFRKRFCVVAVVTVILVTALSSGYRNDRKLIGEIFKHLYQDKGSYGDISLLRGGHSGDRIYKVCKGNEKLAIRIHKHSRNENIRKREYLLAKMASDAGFGPKIVYGDSVSLATLFSTGFHPDETTFENVDALKNLAKSLRLLHEGSAISTKRSMLDTVKVRVARVEKKNPLFLQNPEVLKRFNQIEKVITQANFPEKLCHYDLREGNILVEESKVVLIDWEMAGIADPYSDIASISVEFAFSAKQEEEFLRHYLGKTDSLAREHLFITKQLYILRSALEMAIKSGYPSEKELKRFHKFFKQEGCMLSAQKLSRKELATHTLNVFLKNTRHLYIE